MVQLGGRPIAALLQPPPTGLGKVQAAGNDEPMGGYRDVILSLVKASEADDPTS
jgi:hypothetical protein